VKQAMSGAHDGPEAPAADAETVHVPSPPDDGLSASEKLVERWLRCLPLEREVEKQECLDAAQSLSPRELERRGLGLHKLYIASSETALFGRVLLTLQLSGARPLPPTRLSSGMMVALRSAGAAAASGGRSGGRAGESTEGERPAQPERPASTAGVCRPAWTAGRPGSASVVTQRIPLIHVQAPPCSLVITPHLPSG